MTIGDVWLIALGILLAVILYFEVRQVIEYEPRLDRKIARSLSTVGSTLGWILAPLLVLATDALGAGPALGRLNPCLNAACALFLLVLCLLAPSRLRLAADAAFEIGWLGVCGAAYVVIRPFVGWIAGPAVARVCVFVLFVRAALRVGRVHEVEGQ